MLTYELKKAPGVPLYEALYRHVREDILSGRLPAGTRLPSKRALAENLKVSKITVETAYGQLLSEGYIRSEEKVGYFVEAAVPPAPKPLPPMAPERETPERFLDLTANGPAAFPFSVWSRLQREVMLERGDSLLRPLDNQGCRELRRAIAGHLADFRGMAIDPDNILIGAGTDFLCNLLIQLLGRGRRWAVEEPGYGKIRRIYAAGGVECVGAPMDDQGVIPETLGDAGVLHISPSHHFPTGLVTSAARRLELLKWAESAGSYLIEDDYDSEFRFRARPISALQTMDRQGRVIYMNTFSKSLAPSIRIGYMVLPPELMALYRQKLGFYSCTVPAFEQYTLARFLEEDCFEKHINRMRKFYRARRNRVADALESCGYAGKLTLLERDAGLHFLVKVDTALSDEALMARFREAGVQVRTLGSFYHSAAAAEHFLVVNYSGLDENELYRLNQVRL